MSLDTSWAPGVRRAPQYGIRQNRFTAKLHEVAQAAPPPRKMPWHRSDMDNPLFREAVPPYREP